MAYNGRVETDRLLRFGTFELDAASGELRRAGRRVRLAQQPFRVLWLLASRGGEVVDREEIFRHVWGSETFVDFERGLNFCVLQIRRALGDDARSPRFVETVPRRGYRLVAPVESVEAVAGAARKGGGRWVAAALLAVAAALALAFFLTRSVDEPSERVMLAVLPFKNLSGDPSQDYFSDGFTEELIAQLGGLDPESLGVIARTTMERFKASPLDVAEIGRELGVGYVLEGSVRRDEGQVRITAQLIAVDDQTHVWAESYDRNRWGALVVQRDVGRSIAQELRLQLLPEERSLPDRAGSHRPAAHDAYLKGRYLQNKRNGEDLLRSVSFFEEAIELDPEFALPRAALSETYHLLVMTGPLTPGEGYPLAKEAAFEALERAPFLAEAHLAAGRVAFWYDWDWEEARRRFVRAMELNPSSAEAHHDYGWYLIAQGRAEEGLAEIARARELDPLAASINVDAGWALIQARRYDEARAQCRRTLEIEPGFPEAEFCLKWVDLLKNEDGDAQAAFRRRHERLLASETTSPHTLAVSYALLGEDDEALTWLEEASERRQPSMALIAVDPAFDGVRGDPRFASIVERVGLSGVARSSAERR